MSEEQEKPTAEKPVDEPVTDPDEADLHQVLKATGRIVPQTTEEVAQAEALIDDDADGDLPARLVTPPTGPSVHVGQTKKEKGTPKNKKKRTLRRRRKLRK